MSTNIYKVHFVSFNIEKSNPPLLTIDAVGEVNSSDWRNPILFQKPASLQPEDGIQDFYFQASPPKGLATQSLRRITAKVTVELKSWVKGVRVHSSTNIITVNLSDL